MDKVSKYFVWTLVVLAIIFVVQNLQPVAVNLFIWHFTMPKAILIILLLLLGYLVGYLVSNRKKMLFK